MKYIVLTTLLLLGLCGCEAKPQPLILYKAVCITPLGVAVKDTDSKEAKGEGYFEMENGAKIPQSLCVLLVKEQ